MTKTDLNKAIKGAGIPAESMKQSYLEALACIERLHQRLLDVIKDELDRIGCTEINSVQALLLYNIGEAEMTAGELRTRGHYLGSNVSYNLKKLVETGYISHQRSEIDRRSVRVRLTPTGLNVCNAINDLYTRHCEVLSENGELDVKALQFVSTTLHRLDRFWTEQIRFRI